MSRTITQDASFKSVIRTPAGDEGIDDRSNMYCTTFRPCADADCDHLNCYQYREWASVPCNCCQEEIGYDQSFFTHNGYSIHTGCLVAAAYN